MRVRSSVNRQKAKIMAKQFLLPLKVMRLKVRVLFRRIEKVNKQIANIKRGIKFNYTCISEILHMNYIYIYIYLKVKFPRNYEVLLGGGE